MKLEFSRNRYERLAYDPNYDGKLPIEIVTMYRKRIITIQQAKNRLDLYNLKSLKLEKLKGKRQGFHSIRINDQYRLILEFKSTKGSEEEKAIIHGIEDYHK